MSIENAKTTSSEEDALRELQQAEADFKKAEKELRKAVSDLEAARKHRLVTILVDGHDRQVRPGSWVVKDLKNDLGIDPAKVLAEITPQGLKDLPDEATIEVCEGLKFMTHARSGGAS